MGYKITLTLMVTLSVAAAVIMFVAGIFSYRARQEAFRPYKEVTGADDVISVKRDDDGKTKAVIIKEGNIITVVIKMKNNKPIDWEPALKR